MRTEELQDRLQLVGRRDLYEFLRMSRDSRPDALQERARQIVNSIRSKGERGLKAEARRELAEACQGIFRNARTKREYDQTLPRAAGGGGIRTLASRAAMFLLAAGIVGSVPCGWGSAIDVWPDGASSGDGPDGRAGGWPRAEKRRRGSNSAGGDQSGAATAAAEREGGGHGLFWASAGRRVTGTKLRPAAPASRRWAARCDGRVRRLSPWRPSRRVSRDASKPDRAVFDVVAPETRRSRTPRGSRFASAAMSPPRPSCTTCRRSIRERLRRDVFRGW